MKQLAHRGASAHTDENTIEAVKLAYKMGADGCEIDVHVCKTGELIVRHDDTFDSTTDRTGKIVELTLNEIKQATTKSGFQVPTLRELLAVVPKNKMLNVELKGIGSGHAFVSRWERFYQPLVAAEQLLFSSFRDGELKEIPKTFKIASFIDDPETDLDNVPTDNRFSVHMRGDVASGESISYFQEKGLKVFVWTVNDTTEMKRLINLGADGIFTDDPLLLAETVRSFNKPV